MCTIVIVLFAGRIKPVYAKIPASLRSKSYALSPKQTRGRNFMKYETPVSLTAAFISLTRHADHPPREHEVEVHFF